MFKRFFGNLVWLITSLGAIHLGLLGLGYDVFTHSLFQTTLQGWVIPIHYVIGVAGVLSLIMYFFALTSKHCSCDDTCCK